MVGDLIPCSSFKAASDGGESRNRALPFLRRLDDEVVAGEVVQKDAGKRQRTGAVESGNSKSNPPGTLCESSSELESKYSLTTSTLTWILNTLTKFHP